MMMKNTIQSHCSFFAGIFSPKIKTTSDPQVLVCLSVINQSSRPYSHAVIFSIMQHCLSAQGQFIVYLLSTAALTISILHMSLSALRCHHNRFHFHWRTGEQSDWVTGGVRVMYTGPGLIWQIALHVGTQQAGCKSIDGPSCNLTFIGPDKTRRCDEWRWRDIVTMMRPVVIGSLQPWHSSPNLAQ